MKMLGNIILILFLIVMINTVFGATYMSMFAR